MHKSLRLALALAATASALAAAGCGGGGSATNGNGTTAGHRGGTLTMLDVGGGIDSLDPGYWYYQSDYTEMAQPAQRELYAWPANATKPAPDLAQAMPSVSQGGKTITIKIKRGIHYSPPLASRTVKADDFKYAIERCFKPQVGNGYVGSYYSQIVGAAAFQAGKANEITGIQTPDDHTLVLHTTTPVGVLANGNALTLPCTVPIPRDYAAKYDKGAIFHYGEHQVFTGPYMIQGAQTGTIPSSGYQPSKLLVLVRNPSWKRSTDFRPANFDRIVIKGGNDPTVASRQILDGQSMVSGDYAAPPTAILKEALSSRRSQVTIAPSQSIRYIAFDTKVKPLDNVDFRRAIVAVTNKVALRQTRGGPAIGIVATHMIPPGMPGFQEAGGNNSPYDFEQHPNGDLALAMQYMKKAGYPSGKYTGPPLLMVADDSAPASKTAEAFQQQLSTLGVKTQFHEVPHATMLSKFCLMPKAAVAICPTLGWGKDFFDTQSMIDPLFNGHNIASSGNTNEAQVNDPQINSALDTAAKVVDPAQRARLYAQIDRQVMGQAYYDPWIWDNQVGLASKNVNLVWNKFNTTVDLAFSSLK